MKKVAYSIAVVTALSFSGCALGGGGGYTQANVGQTQIIKSGTVLSAKMIQVNDDGTGTILGAIAGGLIGAQFGGTNTDKALAGVGGAIAGGALGNTVNSSTGQELTIRLDDGTEIRTVKNVNSNSPMSFRDGDRVRVFFEGGRVAEVVLAH